MSAASTAAPPAKPAAAANKDSDDEDEVEQLQYKVSRWKRENDAMAMRCARTPLDRDAAAGSQRGHRSAILPKPARTIPQLG